MKLEYKIIWVDDSPEWVDSVVSDIEEHVRDAEFEPIIERLEQSEGVIERCNDLDLDLLIIDYKLPGMHGNELISKIRDAEKFTEVVFYSQDQPSQQLIGVIDGVFHCQRDSAVAKIKTVIDLTLHKLRDLGVMRGLVIASAIDIEVRLEEVMVKLFKGSGLIFRELVLDKQWADCAKKHAFLQGFIKDRIAELPDGDLKKKLEAAKNILSAFDREVIDQRNILAHSKRVVKDGKTVLEGINKRTREVTFDAAWRSEIRGNLRKHLRNLEEIDALLSTLEASAGEGNP